MANEINSSDALVIIYNIKYCLQGKNADIENYLVHLHVDAGLFSFSEQNKRLFCIHFYTAEFLFLLLRGYCTAEEVNIHYNVSSSLNFILLIPMFPSIIPLLSCCLHS